MGDPFDEYCGIAIFVCDFLCGEGQGNDLKCRRVNVLWVLHCEVSANSVLVLLEDSRALQALSTLISWFV